MKKKQNSDVIKSAETLVRSALSRSKSRVNEKTIRAVAEKVSRAIPKETTREEHEEHAPA
jgi:hypothetical protein